MTRNVSPKLAVALCLALVASLSVMATTAFAYYTDTSQANGMIAFSWEPDEPHTDVDEKLHGLDKEIVIRNTSEGDQAAPALVRVQLIHPDPTLMDGGVTIEVTAGDGWVKDGDWYYFSKPIEPGASTASIKVDVEVKDKEKLRPFDIVAIQQCAKVEYTTDTHQLCGTFAASEGPVVIPGAAAQQEAGE